MKKIEAPQTAAWSTIEQWKEWLYKFYESATRNKTITFTAGDTTPSVYNSELFTTANTAATTITDFDDGYENQRITVIVGDGNTTFDFTSSSLKGNGGVDWSPSSGDHMTCVYDGSQYWYCTVSEN